MAKLNLTLIFYLSLLLAIAASSNASSHRRGHADLGRLVKKRAAISTPANESSSQDQQTPSSSPTVSPSQASSTEAQTTSVAAQTTPQVSSDASSGIASATGLLDSLTSGLLPTEPSAASSPALATTPASSNQPASNSQTDSDPTNQVSAATATGSILYLTTSSGAPTPTQTSSNSTSSGISHAAVTVLIVIAASVGASVIVWTVIRKWKFRPSSDFEGRMQPIDWHPDGNNEDVGGHRPLSRASSFHSGSGNGPIDDEMRGIGGYGATVLNPIPDHDFTAGPAHLAPVGGYADLARGPSPQPMAQESQLGRSLTVNRPVQHDQFGVPLHHGYTGY